MRIKTLKDMLKYFVLESFNYAKLKTYK